jgi:hypothetical protein
MEFMVSMEQPGTHYHHAVFKCEGVKGERARIAALLGMKEETVELLRQSFSRGKWDDVFIIQEADFEPLRDYGPFREFMKPKG